MTKQYPMKYRHDKKVETPEVGAQVYSAPTQIPGSKTVYLYARPYMDSKDYFGWIPSPSEGPRERCIGTLGYAVRGGSFVEFDEQDKPTPQPINSIQPLKESIMTQLIDKTITTNKSAAISAAFMEAGRLANNQTAKALAKKAPVLVRGYVETPIGKLVIANVAVLAAQQFRPNDASVQKLTQAMAVQAYQELIQQLNIEEFIDELLESKDIKRALTKLPLADEAAAA